MDMLWVNTAGRITIQNVNFILNSTVHTCKWLYCSNAIRYRIATCTGKLVTNRGIHGYAFLSSLLLVYTENEVRSIAYNQFNVT